jgi:NAD/NADP transhydrogenase beta subunit
MKFLSQQLKSKTVIVNTLTVAVGVLGYLAGHDVIAQNPEVVAALVSVVGVVNVLLRLVTIVPVSAK